MSSGRMISESGFYHVVQKGAGDQIIFESDFDRIKYVQILEDCLKKHSCLIYAWCLMSNHAHLLIRADLETLSVLMHDLGLRYAKHFNTIKGHNGPVFQGRYFSEPIESDSHFLSAIRYIHNNPQKASICKASEYKWSSYWEYANERRFVETSFVIDLLGSRKAFESFSMNQDDFQSSIREDSLSYLNDEAAFEIVKNITDPLSPAVIKTMRFQDRKRIILQLKEAGIRISQAARITGIGKSTISRIYNGK